MISPGIFYVMVFMKIYLHFLIIRIASENGSTGSEKLEKIFLC